MHFFDDILEDVEGLGPTQLVAWRDEHVPTMVWN